MAFRLNLINAFWDRVPDVSTVQREARATFSRAPVMNWYLDDDGRLRARWA